MKGHCSLYSFDSGKQFLGYTTSSEVITFPEAYPITMDISDVKPSHYPDLEIINLDELFTTKRTVDKRLAEEHITTFSDLYYSNYLIKLNLFKKSANIRQLVLNKYADIMEYED